MMVAAASVVVVAAVGGYVLGSSRDAAFEVVGTAYFTDTQIGLEGDDWTYHVPLDVRWTDREGTWHEGGRPACLPPSDTTLEGVRVSAVPVEVQGLGFRQVVAVHCD